MSVSTPLRIVLTPVRNEAWVLRAFLEATSLWADYIIIVDQMSTDGSREIAKDYPNVILLDNNRPEMHMAAARKLLFEEVRKIEGDKILFALDADEFLSGDFVNTEDWKRITNSKPNDCFSWRWMNLKEGDASKYSTWQHYYWAVHESKDLWEGAYPDNFIHEWRLPWPPKGNDEGHDIRLDGFCSIHLARVNVLRQRNKQRFYQVSTISNDPNASAVSLYRHYHGEEKMDYFDVPIDAYSLYERHGLDIWKYVNLQDEGQYYNSEVLRYFEKDGLSRYRNLDIWDKDWMERVGLNDNPQSRFQKLLLRYLKKTMPYSKSVLVRGIDKILKQFV